MYLITNWDEAERKCARLLIVATAFCGFAHLIIAEKSGTWYNTGNRFDWGCST